MMLENDNNVRCKSAVSHNENGTFSSSIVLNEYSVPLTELNDDKEQASKLALVDLSYLNRVGFKGANAIDFQSRHNIIVPENINSANNNLDVTVIRLGETETLIISKVNKSTHAVERIEQAYELLANDDHQIIRLPRQDSHALFYLTGKCAESVLAKLCSVDLRSSKFPQFTVAQTVLARVSIIIVRIDYENVPGYYLLSDVSLGQYLWDCLDDAMQEFNGHIIGINALNP